MSPRDAPDVRFNADQDGRGDTALTAALNPLPGRHLMYEGTAAELVKGARQLDFGADDLAPAAPVPAQGGEFQEGDILDAPPRLLDLNLNSVHQAENRAEEIPLHKDEDEGAPSRGVAGALELAAHRLTTAFGAAAAAEPIPPPASSSFPPTPPPAGPTGGGLLTQTASGGLAKVPSAGLDLRPHTGQAGGAQRLLAAAMASVGSLARARARARARAAGSGGGGGAEGGEGDEGEAALVSAATALERAMEEIGAAAADVARTELPEQEGPGMYGTGEDKFPAAFPSKVTPREATAAARDPAAMAAVYGNVQRSYAAALQASPEAAAAIGAHENIRKEDQYDGGGDGESADGGAAAECTVDIPYADVNERVPPGYQLLLNATSAVIAPLGTPQPDDADVAAADDDGGRVGSPGAYVYDKPGAPPPGSMRAAAVSCFAGAADWAWDDPDVDAPPAPADGGLVPDSATAIHDAEVAAAAAAMPSVIRDADDPATSPPGPAAAATYDNHAVSSPRGGGPRSCGKCVIGAAADVDHAAAAAAAAAAKLPPVPADLDEAAREVLGPHGLERAAEETAAAVATIAPPRYVTPFPPRLLDMLREPSARDLAGV
ncbi:hypothetical protein VOLCADRAFT_96287 [Volvox carteri f. nagariensis]|uniref:Uncharacterized protein n=1 Tax=Volvox carteri f. nagariensis TaxID=3068 RepID=D8U9Q2_VOLCA|nr:uncharacterized protein VOLCADRAFT_96287 [Volvox carteri f. nagariensis]EFJ43512.1 hypothetical protein VOLCADRAFT_96287 [Volvox carteri f. nagariensis]|eukprot:XP_002955441.1 hypothetical protein VOLCADRAFT_96287 [Volvox carteri f. nagariensis]